MLDELFSYIPRLISNITNTEFSIEVNELSPNDSVVFGTSVVHASAAKHGVPAFCYRFETITESVTISGDTEFSEDVIEASRGSSLLIHECPFPSQIGATPGHTTPHQVGIVANEAKVECVVLTHLFEEVMGFEDQIRQDVKVSYPGRVVIGEDLMKIVVERENIRTFTS